MSPTNAHMLTSTDLKEQPPFYASRASEIQSPPAYSSTAAGSSSASTAATPLPAAFKINGRNVTPRIDLADVKSHLLLLGAFRALRGRVSTLSAHPSLEGLGPTFNAEAKWSLFVKRAVYRFERWFAALERARIAERALASSKLSTEELPPLDILMVWHSYCLNPRTYASDLTRRPYLAALASFPLHEGASLVDPSTHDYAFGAAQQAVYAILMGGNSSPDLPMTTALSDVLEGPLECPACANPCHGIPWLSRPEPGKPIQPSEGVKSVPKDRGGSGGRGLPILRGVGVGYGWAQTEFLHTCDACGLAFGKDALCVRKLGDDLAPALKNGSLLPSFTLEASTGLPPTTISTPSLCFAIVQEFAAVFPDPSNPARTSRARQMREFFLAASMQDFWQAFDVGVAAGRIPLGLTTSRWMSKLWPRYTFEASFGIELVGAVLRQGSFIVKMSDELGWTKAGRFEENPYLITRAIGRYHAFLDLMSAKPMSFFCPTLDIDLGWHTHQLMTTKYRDDMIAYTGSFTDHDDKVEEGALDLSYRVTASAWRQRFGVSYSTCGCQPIEQDSPGTKLLGLLKKKKKKDNQQGPMDGDRVDDDERDASHPSNHNRVVLVGNPRLVQSKKYRTSERRKHDAMVERAWRKANPDLKASERRRHDNNVFLTESPYTATGYWGVGLTTTDAGAAAWGMGPECDPECQPGDDMPRGACAAGAGYAGAGFCAVGGIGWAGGIGANGMGGGGGCGGGGGGT